MEANVRKRMNVAPITRYFKDVAQHAIKRMKDELAGGGGKVSYKDYIVATERYLIPILGRWIDAHSNWPNINVSSPLRAGLSSQSNSS